MTFARQDPVEMAALAQTSQEPGALSAAAGQVTQA